MASSSSFSQIKITKSKKYVCLKIYFKERQRARHLCIPRLPGAARLCRPRSERSRGTRWTLPAARMSIGVPIKVLHEAEGHIVTCETNTGEVYRGKLIEAEDNMNCQMSNISHLQRQPRGAAGAGVHPWQQDPLSDFAQHAEKCTHVEEHEKQEPALRSRLRESCHSQGPGGRKRKRPWHGPWEHLPEAKITPC